MWQPDPGWHPLPGGSGPSTLGVWRAEIGGRAVVVKRLTPPAAYDPTALSDPHHFAYWRRSADVATAGLVDRTPGMTGPATSVEEDPDGITLVADWVEDAHCSGLFVALSMGRFAGAELPEVDWLARRQLRDRMDRVEERGGWPTLARTPAAEVAAELWRRRGRWLDLLDDLPQVPQHGDPTARNLRGRDGDRLLAIDWSSLGHGPVGADLGLFVLTAREELGPLLGAYLDGLPGGVATRDEVALAARVSAVYTAVSRAEWALARVAGGEGALDAKLRHPAVAPHLRALQRQVGAIEALLGG